MLGDRYAPQRERRAERRRRRNGVRAGGSWDGRDGQMGNERAMARALDQAEGTSETDECSSLREPDAARRCIASSADERPTLA